MPQFKIDDYSVGITQQKTSHYDHIYFTPPSSDSDPFKNGVMYFFSNRQDAGYQNPANGWVVATPPQSTFADTYRILQTETPVYFHWAADPTTNRLYWSQLGTSDEPPGEGPRDLSP